MSINKRLINTGEAAAFDPIQNFETVTYTGNGGTQKITGYIRKGAAFNGSSSSIVNTSFGISGNAARSYSAWVYTNGSTTGTICGVGNHGVAGQSMYLYIDQSTSTWSLWGFTAAYDLENNSVAAIGSLSNGWHHFVLTWDASSTFKLYIDGSLADTKTKSATYNTPAEFAIGRWYDSGYYFNSKIDQVRIFNKAIDSSEVTTLYNETYDSSTKSTTDIFGDSSGIALYELDEDANDTGVPIDSGQSAVFNGSSSSISTSIPSSTFTSSFSASAWFNTSNATLEGFVFEFQNNFYLQAHLGKIKFQSFDGNYDYIEAPYITNNWHHIVVTRNGTSFEAFLDGSSIGTFTSSPATTSTSGVLTIGKRAFNNTQYWDGKIDQVRIYSSALSSGDVTNLYNESSVPTSGLVAHYKLDGNANDETGSYNGTATNVTYSDEVAGIYYNGTPTNINFLGMAFQPDLVWIKNRDTTAFNSLFDSVRGFGFLSSNTTAAEDNLGVVNLQSYDSNGFTTGNDNGTINAVGNNHVAWCWKAGGAAVTNTDGSITSQVSANPDAGFSILKFTVPASGDFSAGHGLSSTPELVITKSTDTFNWFIYHKDLSSGANGVYMLQFNTNAENGNFKWWGNSMTSSVIGGTSETAFDASTDTIAYCFHSVDGYQKVGTYAGVTGTKTVSGLGFEPRFLIIKRTDNTGDWLMYDSIRGTGVPTKGLIANSNTTEFSDSTNTITFTSDGFEVAGNYSHLNISGGTYIYLAIA